jgi:NitT/TauT family transport system permease protein
MSLLSMRTGRLPVRAYPTEGAVRRPRFSLADVVVGIGVVGLLYLLVRLGRGMDVAFLPETAAEQVPTEPSNLPYYAARSLLRMFIALGASLAFTFVVGTAAARSRRAQLILVSALDILQSVPILGGDGKQAGGVAGQAGANEAR